MAFYFDLAKITNGAERKHIYTYMKKDTILTTTLEF
jgi:hypothetical protein